MKLWPSSLSGLLILTFFLSVFTNKSAFAADITQQLHGHHPSSTQNNLRAKADQLLQLGQQQSQIGQTQEALQSWFSALEHYYQIEDLTSMGLVYDFISLTYVKLEDYASAERALRRRLAIAQDGRDFASQILGWNNLGTLLLEQAQFTEAKQAFEIGLSVSRNTGNRNGEGLSLSNLGLLAMSSGNPEQAIIFYKAARQIRFSEGDLIGTANTSNNLGDAYQANNRIYQARGAYAGSELVARIENNQSVSEDVLQPFSPDQSNTPTPTSNNPAYQSIRLRAIDGLVTTYLKSQQYAAAVNLLEERLLVIQGLDDHSQSQQLKTLYTLAQTYEQVGNFDDAILNYQNALEIAKQINDTVQSTLINNRLLNLGIESN